VSCSWDSSFQAWGSYGFSHDVEDPIEGIMPFDFSRFLLDIENRFRRLRGLSHSSLFLFYGSIVCVVVGLILRWLIPDLAQGVALLVLFIPFSTAAVGFLLGWWKHPELPHLLLQLDDQLDSGARISSLYEIRVAQQTSFFRIPLENLVQSLSADWKKGISLPRRTFSFFSAGIVGIIAACCILLLPISFLRAASSESSAKSETSVAQATHSSVSESSVNHGQTASEEADLPPKLSADSAFSQRDLTEEATQTPDREEISLDSVLDALSSLSQSSAQVGAAPTSDELLDLAETQKEARQELSEMLMDLQERMQNSPRPLTQQEAKSLQALAAQTGDPEIREQTDDLVNEPNPDQIGEKIQDLMDKVDPNSAEPGTSSESDEENGDGSGRDTPRSTEISGDQEAGQRFLEPVAAQLEEQASAEAEQDESSPLQSSSQDEEDAGEIGEVGSAGIRMVRNPDDLAQVGSEEGMGGVPVDEPAPGEVGFVREEAVSTIGEDGEFVDEFVTRGVPVETAPSENRTGATHIVDFDRMESILRERGLPDEALDSVRRYFELITQPEGGS